MIPRDERVIRKSGHVVSRVVDGEAVIVEPQNGMVNVISTTGSRIWELTDGRRTVAELADIISSEYDVSPETAFKDTIAFVEDMQNKGCLASTKAAIKPCGAGRKQYNS